MTLIDLSGDIPADPFDAVLHAWHNRDWSPRPGSLDVEGWTCAAVTVGGQDGWLLQRRFDGGRLYGTGEAFEGLNLAGRQRVLINRETNGAGAVDLAYLNVALLYSDTGWGMLIDSGAIVLMDLGQTLTVLVLDPRPSVRTFAGTPREILRDYTALTGRPPQQWPDWAFGTWMSRATYLSAAEMVAAVHDLQAADCPVDVIHIDAWMTGNVFREFTTNWEVDRRRFPEGWTQQLRALGVRVSVWLNPFITAGTALARTLACEGFLVRDAGGGLASTCDRDYRHLIDFTNPLAVAWWQATIKDFVGTEGPDALKLDFAEEVPPSAVFHDGRPGWLLRNEYAALYQRLTYDVAPVPFFCRSGGVGSQSNPCHWVGDTPADWAGMAGALTACLSLSASGFALVTHDGGGFHTPGTSKIPALLLDGEPGEFVADVDPELYGRWAQFASLSPVTRFHGLGLREPTAYPSPWREAAIEALRRRRELLPDLQRALAIAHRTGLPVMRPMMLMTEDSEGASAQDQYFLGDDILVAPLLTPGGRRRMWLPEGEWVPILGQPHITGHSGWVDVACGPSDYPAFRRARGHNRPQIGGF